MKRNMFLSLIITIMLLSGLAFAGNKPGFMTSDQKDALDGANAPSASNVLATADDILAADTGVQTVTPGVNLSNSGDADNPILDLDISEDIDMNTSYQLKHLAAPAADGEAIRQTAKITESGLESGIDRLNELESTDTPQFASVNIAGNYQFPQAIGSSGEALKVPAAGSLLEWGSAGGVSYAQYVTVAKSGGDYTTVTAALASISDATTDKRYAILIYPGVYTEAAITCKQYVDLIGLDRHLCTIRKTEQPGSGVLVSASNIIISNLTIRQEYAFGYQAPAINMSGSITVKDCYLYYKAGASGDKVPSVDANGSKITAYRTHFYAENTSSNSGGGANCILEPGSLSEFHNCTFETVKNSNNSECNAIYVSSAARTHYFWCSNFLVAGNSSSIAIRAGANGTVYMYNCRIVSSGTNDGHCSNIYIHGVPGFAGVSAGTINLLDEASLVKNTAAGNIAATNVQGALDELDDEKIQQEKGYNVKVDFGSSDIVTDGSGDGTVIADYDDYSVAPKVYVCLGEDMNDTSFVLCVDVAYADTALLRLREGAVSDTITINWQSIGQE